MDTPSHSAKTVDTTTRTLRLAVSLVVGAMVIAGGLGALAYGMSPVAIRQPASAHYHFRLQVVVDGKTQNFADARYQTDFNKDICSAALTKEPFHFHDKLDEFVHVHWAGMTGGLLLKHYGWNQIGGLAGVLGYQFNDGWPRPVAIHGPALPAPGAGDQYYIYTGDQNEYKERRWSDFIGQGLEDFFAGKSVRQASSGLVPAAAAHGDDPQEHAGDQSEAELIRLNHVVGNAVIFAQKDRPTEDQVRARFRALIALPESSCGG